MTIKEILIDGRVEPINVGSLTPEFSWKYLGEDFEEQKSYRIIVTTEKGDTVWDSREVKSKDCCFIKYNGKELKSSTVYQLKIIVKSVSGKVSEKLTSFETALLSNEDWGGGFIGTTLNYVGNSSIVRKVYDIKDKPIKRARAYVVGLGYHELFINDKKVTDNLYNPPVSDYNKKIFYETYDLNSYLVAGKNAFSLELGYGWYGNKVARVKLLVEYSDGEVYTDHTASDGYWWVTGGAYQTGSIYGGEVYNSNAWAAEGLYKDPEYQPYFNKGWMCALYQLAPNVPLVSDYLEPIKVLDEYPVKSIKKIDENTFVYDFGANIAGRVNFTVKGEKNDKVILRYAEDIKENGEVNQLNLRSADATDTYILKGGEERFYQRFTYHGFRYVEFKIEGKAVILSATAEHIHNAVKSTGEFKCSNETLNKLHELVLRTEKNNLHSFMTDCPQRDERIPWLNDLTTRLYQNVYNFNMFSLYKKTSDEISETMDKDGAVSDTAPYIAGFRPADPVSASYLILGLFCYRYYGNKSVMEQHFDGYVKWVDCLINRCEDNLLTLSYYGDWVLPNVYVSETPDKVFVSSIFLYWQMEMLIKMAKILGKKKIAKKYSKTALILKDAINQKYYDKENKTYKPSYQSMLALALGIGIVPEGDEKAVYSNLLKNIENHGGHSACGNQSYRHMFYTLCENKDSKKAIDILVNPEYPGWGYMLSSGATSMWERWEKEMQLEMHSFNHPMFTSFDAIFYRYFAGIKIDEDACGCNKITLSPDFSSGLSFVDCSFDTVRGKIESSFKVEDNKVYYKFTVPPTITAKLEISGYTANQKILDKYSSGTYELVLTKNN